MANIRDITKASDSRVWIIEDRANPGNVPEYQGLMRLGDPSQALGDVTDIEAPSTERAGEFEDIDEIQGSEDRVEFSIMGRYPRATTSTMKRLSEKRCGLDIQAHLGRCYDPLDFNGGWEKIIFFEATRLTNYGIENAGALESSEENPTNESADTSARIWYERVRLNFAEKAATDVMREIVSIDVCDAVNCGECGDSSQGCDQVFAVMAPSGASPGTAPTLVYTDDGFQTSGTTLIDSLLGNEPASDSECVGPNFVVISNTDNSLNYADIEDILLGTETWTQTSTGFVVGGEPNAIVSPLARFTWVVGNGGYVYFTADPTTGVTVQDAAQATSENLNDVDAIDSNNAVAVGDNNAVIYTQNGSSWSSVTGPSAGVNLTTVGMKDKNTWIVGNASGDVYYTKNAGLTWTQVTLPVTATNVRDIQFSTNSVGTMSVDIAGPAGRLLGTIDGGDSWYVLPEGAGSIPANDQINQVAPCAENANIIYAGGLGDDASDGIILKLS